MFKLTDIAIILFITTGINIFTTCVSWLKRKADYGLFFASGMIGVTLWTFAAGLDYAAIPIPLKVFFAQLECLGYQSALALFAVSMILFAGHKSWLEKTWVRVLFIVIPVSSVLLAWTNDWHGWFWSNFVPSRVGDNVVVFEHGPAFLWAALTAYLMLAVIVLDLLQVAFKGTVLLRKQARLLLVAVIVLVTSNLLYLLDVFRVPGVDWSSVTFSVIGILFLLVLYGTRFMEIVPIARDLLVEQMTDGILVLDALGYLVDFNSAAQDVFGLSKDDLRRVYEVSLKPYPNVVALLTDHIKQGVQGGYINVDGSTYDAHLIALTDQHDVILGHLVSLRDISEQRRMEDALRYSEEKFFKAFHSSPDAVLISRLQDGKFVDVNEGFCRMTGYTREEALASSTVAIDLWANPEDREKVVETLKEKQRIFESEYDFRIKSGGLLHCLYSGELIQLGGEAYILSVARDITERNRAEETVRLGLKLWEYATVHTLDELMQKALDEIGNLTDSPIGFYHFVEEDQNTLSLQAWSTRTLAEFCNAEGKDRHYPISDAGVWVDCVRERKPVIHNDYASLPHRKGLPTGHAKVVRELVIPTIRNEQVVAILGVGNKSIDYNEKDVELVSYIADTIWTIVEQKRANEQIRQLNARLEQLAMTDELTGLFNRRLFFRRGAEELLRSRRYQLPLSLLMMDIDGFKAINDTYGHDAGDLILRCVADTLQRNIRDVDVLARLGGEEFGVLLPNTGAQDAFNLAERLKKGAAQATCSIPVQNPGVTLSIGVASLGESVTNIDHLLKNADRAMYQAKNQGRDRVVLFS